jgi:hypothetical protein
MRSIPVLLLCVVVAGCSPSSSDDSTTTVVTSASTTAATTTTTLSPTDARAAFVTCLGDEGVEIPAHAFDADGSPRLGAVAESLDTSDAAVQAAVAECSPLLSTTQAVDLAADPEVRMLVIEQLTAFTQCMRDQGVTDFPDPDTDAPVDSPYSPDDVPFSAPGFDDASATCRDMVGAFGMGNG